MQSLNATSGPLISAEKVEGVKVFAANGDQVGHVKGVMLHKEEGEVAYAVLALGGFLGVGERQHPVPWSTLHYDKGKDGFVLPIAKERLEAAPSYEAGEIADSDLQWRESVYTYYGVPPYWIM
jgi:sporulation protein YlmC with PRC-barrel domain